jgi:hypothetical protein
VSRWVRKSIKRIRLVGSHLVVITAHRIYNNVLQNMKLGALLDVFMLFNQLLQAAELLLKQVEAQLEASFIRVKRVQLFLVDLSDILNVFDFTRQVTLQLIKFLTVFLEGLRVV